MEPATLLRPLGGRIFLTAVSLAMLGGWATAVVNLYLSYAPVDGEAGLSIQDVRFRFGGNPESNRLLVMVNGPMRENFSNPEMVGVFTEWSREPGREGFDEEAHRARFEDKILPVIQVDCQVCHLSGGAAGFAPFRTYEDLRPLLEPDRGMTVVALARLSHFHLIGMGTLVLLTGLLAFAYLPGRVAAILSALAGSGLLLDVGGWWATKLLPEGAQMTMVGGTLFGAGVVLAHAALLCRYWKPVLRNGPAIPVAPERIP